MRILLFMIWLNIMTPFLYGQTVLNAPAQFITKFKYRQLNGGVILLTARLNNIEEDLNFILDTGSGGISLDSSTASNYKVHNIPSGKKVHGIAGIHRVNYAPNSKFTFPGLVVDSLDLYINDYNILSSVYGIKIDGIIGYSFLKRYIVEVNFDSLNISIYTPGKFKYPKRGTLFHPNFTSLPIQGLYIKDQKEILSRFYFDTGAGLCLLVTKQFLEDSSFLLKKRKPVAVQVQGLGGKKELQITVSKRLRLGPYRFRKVPTTILDDEFNALSYPHLVGLIGNDIMRRFNMVINYPAKEIHMIPNSHFRDHFDYSYTGTNFYFEDGQILAGDVIKKSPAEKAGLQSDDVILGVNNNFSGDIQAYNNLMNNPGKDIKLIILRNKELKTIQFKVGKIY